ncbi:serine/threonine-protein phosphatase 7 long form homolog [Beta vulgaris subsp. vulgaris]|uniref:serine/threonine-protein phosphatase 7 long form homolog n=1 Tax=Beta vulgaris subsp. vulgaris TaxID=3555 RepID=UPI00254798CA|nr:serine/threonine-protein phosphatase 7 long form homolog [Beta vulgaris subsp. vulgaris]
MLGIWPNTPENEPKVLQGSSLRLTWLRQHFFLLPNDANEVTVQRFARAYILALMGSILFADKSGDAIQVLYLPLLADLDVAGTYSWGSATLAYLYRQLCRASHRGARELGGPVLLLQIWAWEHIHIGRPRISRVRDPPPQFDEAVPILGSQHVPGIDPLAVSWLRVHISRSHTAGGLPYYRDALDHQTDEQMTWQPYTDARLALLPAICRADRHVWRTMAPLICFDIVEFHFPGRVMRQFGFEQRFPHLLIRAQPFHAIDRRSKNKNYPLRHRPYIAHWDEREGHIVQGTPFSGRTHAFDEYMIWFRRITRLRLTNPSRRPPSTHYQPASADIVLAHTLSDIAHRCGTVLEASESLPPDMVRDLYAQTLQTMRGLCVDAVGRAGHGHIVQGVPTSAGYTSTSTSSTSAAHISTTPALLSPPVTQRAYRRRSDTTPPSLDAIAETHETTPSSSTPSQKKKRGF